MRIVSAIVSAFLVLPFHTHAAPPFIEVSSKEGKSFEARITASSDEAVTVKTPHGIEYSLQLNSLSNETVEKVKAWKPLKVEFMSAMKERGGTYIELGVQFEKSPHIWVYKDILWIEESDLEFLKSGLDKFVAKYPELIEVNSHNWEEVLLQNQERPPSEATIELQRKPKYDTLVAYYDGENLGVQFIKEGAEFFEQWRLEDISAIYKFRDFLEGLDIKNELQRIEQERRDCLSPFIEVSSKEGKSFEARITASSDEAVTVKTPHGIEYSLQLDSLSDETVEKVKAWKPLKLTSVRVELAEDSLDPVVSLGFGYDTDPDYDIRTVTFKKEDLGFVKSGLDTFIDKYSAMVKIPAPWNDIMLQKQEETLPDRGYSPTFEVEMLVDWSDLTAHAMQLWGQDFLDYDFLDDELPRPNDRHWYLEGISEVYEVRDILENLDHEEIRRLEREALSRRSVLN